VLQVLCDCRVSKRDLKRSYSRSELGRYSHKTGLAKLVTVGCGAEEREGQIEGEKVPLKKRKKQIRSRRETERQTEVLSKKNPVKKEQILGFLPCFSGKRRSHRSWDLRRCGEAWSSVHGGGFRKPISSE
jgi:hypothetical protein